MPARKTLHRRLFFLHRYLGIASAAFVLLLALTGLFFNHTEDLQLDQRHVSWSPLLSWYGIEAPAMEQAFQVDERWFSAVGGQLFLDEKMIGPAGGQLLGVAAAEFYVLAFKNELLLLTHDGELVERLTGMAGVPVPIFRIGIDLDAALPVIETAHGVFRSDQVMFEWQPLVQDAKVEWARTASPPNELKRVITEGFVGQGLSLERILLDMHSGRIAGAIGVFVMDLAALSFILLAAVGVWLWARR